MRPHPILWLIVLLLAIPSPAMPRRATAGPPLVFSTYLGGSTTEVTTGVAVDAAGNTIVVGFTSSTDFPVTNAVQSTYGGGDFDIFVTKYNASGSVVFSTYLGGAARDIGEDVAFDAAGNIYVLGESRSTDFPVTTGAYQTTNHSPGVDDDVVVRLSPNGDKIDYSTYLGGFASEDAFGIAVDSSGNACVVGDTQGGQFPTTPGAFQQEFAGGSNDAYVTKLNSTGSALVYSTLVGGQTSTDVFYGVAVDSAGNAFVSGFASASDYPTANAVQPGYGGGPHDAVAAELNAAGSSLVYSTFLGGAGDDIARGVAVDSGGNAYVTGFTGSTDFPTANPLQPANAGSTFDAFVTKIAPSGAALVYSTYLGSTGQDLAFSVAVDGQGDALVAGDAGAADFPVTPDALQQTFGGSVDAFLAVVNADGTALSYATFLGGAGGDEGIGIALGADGTLGVAGVTLSADFPVENPAQATTAGSADAFVAKLLFSPPAVAELSWEPPSASGSAPPTDLTARIIAVGPTAVATPGALPVDRGARDGVTGYNVYRSGQPNVQPTPANLYTSVPANQTTVDASVGSSGSFFVVTAVYDMDESGASNEVPAGTPGATITKLKVKRTGVTASGTGFTASVQVFLDGIPFASPAKVKNNRMKVAQKGPLITGQTVGAYKPSGSAVEVIFVNNDATITRKTGTIP